jgi:hypothetical protein
LLLVSSGIPSLGFWQPQHIPKYIRGSRPKPGVVIILDSVILRTLVDPSPSINAQPLNEKPTIYDMHGLECYANGDYWDVCHCCYDKVMSMKGENKNCG